MGFPQTYPFYIDGISPQWLKHTPWVFPVFDHLTCCVFPENHKFAFREKHNPCEFPGFSHVVKPTLCFLLKFLTSILGKTQTM